jgi:hypothetical protein
VSRFQQAKLSLMEIFGLPRDALHIYVGLAIFLLAAALFRQPLRARFPILLTLAAAVAGEAWDVIETHGAGKAIAWTGSWHDIWNTCFWPAVLFLLARFTRVLKR